MAKEGLFVSVVADASKALSEFRKVEQGVGKIGKSTDATNTRMGKLSGGASKLGRNLGIAFGSAAVIAFGKNSVTAFGESQVAAERMGTSIANNKLLAGASISEFQNLAKAIEGKTAADDESILSGAAVLGNFNLTKKQIKDTLPLIVDYARRTGTDVPASAEVIGKALLGNARALKALGINFKPTGDAAKDFATITDLVRSKVGGFAEKEAKTATGRMESMKNRFNDLQEVVGGKLVGAFDFLARNMGVIAPILGTIIAAIVTYKIVTGLAALVNIFFGETAAAAWTAAALPIALLVAAVVAVGLVIWKFRDKFIAAFQAIVGFVKRFWPILLPVLLGPIGLAIVGFLKHKDKIVGIFKAIVGGIKAAWSGIAGFVGSVFDGVVSVIRTGINSVIHIINGLIRAYNLLPFHKDIKTLATLAGPAAKGLGSANQETNVRAFASGGVVTRPTMALIGEAGPEAVIPLSRASGMGGGNVTIQVYVQGSVTAEDDLAATIRRKFLELRRRQGPLGFDG